MTHHALWQLFRTRYGLLAQPALTLLDYQSASQQDGQLSLQATLRHHGETRRLQGQGNGLLSAAASGLSALLRQPFMIKDYRMSIPLARAATVGRSPISAAFFHKVKATGEWVLIMTCARFAAGIVQCDQRRRSGRRAKIVAGGDAHHPTKHGAEGAVAAVAQLQRHPQHGVTLRQANQRFH